MQIIYPKSITVKMEEPNGFYFDVELKEVSVGMVFEAWLYNVDYSIKSHIVSVPAEPARNDESIDWLPIICIINDYIANQCLVTRYWELIQMIEY